MKRLMFSFFISFFISIDIISAEKVFTPTQQDINQWDILLQDIIDNINEFKTLSPSSFLKKEVLNKLSKCSEKIDYILNDYEKREEILKYISTNDKYKDLDLNNLSKYLKEIENSSSIAARKKIRFISGLIVISSILSIPILIYKFPKQYNSIINFINRYWLPYFIFIGFIKGTSSIVDDLYEQ